MPTREGTAQSCRDRLDRPCPGQPSPQAQWRKTDAGRLVDRVGGHGHTDRLAVDFEYQFGRSPEHPEIMKSFQILSELDLEGRPCGFLRRRPSYVGSCERSSEGGIRLGLSRICRASSARTHCSFRRYRRPSSAIRRTRISGGTCRRPKLSTTASGNRAPQACVVCSPSGVA